MPSRKNTVPPIRLSSIPLHSTQYVRGRPSHPTGARDGTSEPVSFAGCARSATLVAGLPFVPLGRLLWLIFVSGQEAEDREPPTSDPRPSAGVVSSSVVQQRARRIPARSSGRTTQP